MFDDKSISIYGGTGSLGRDFIGRLLDHPRHRRVVPFSRDKLKQYEMPQGFAAPCIRRFSVGAGFTLDGLGEQGIRVAEDFEYRSDTNPQLLSVAQLADLHSKLPA